jgi:ADP-ribose pyrophosphatase YjhB (NUDIX family)
VLLIREERSFEKWKLPGGVADPGEEWPAAAEREVFEETGVRGIFQNVMLMRNSHGFQFGKSDLYVVCHLKSVEQDSNVIAIDEHEIEEAKWFDIDEWKSFTKHPINLEVIDQLTGIESGKIMEIETCLNPEKPKFRLYVPRGGTQ